MSLSHSEYILEPCVHKGNKAFSQNVHFHYYRWEGGSFFLKTNLCHPISLNLSSPRKKIMFLTYLRCFQAHVCICIVPLLRNPFGQMEIHDNYTGSLPPLIFILLFIITNSPGTAPGFTGTSPHDRGKPIIARSPGPDSSLVLLDTSSPSACFYRQGARNKHNMSM